MGQRIPFAPRSFPFGNRRLSFSLSLLPSQASVPPKIRKKQTFQHLKPARWRKSKKKKKKNNGGTKRYYTEKEKRGCWQGACALANVRGVQGLEGEKGRRERQRCRFEMLRRWACAGLYPEPSSSSLFLLLAFIICGCAFLLQDGETDTGQRYGLDVCRTRRCLR
jgi:hypothetical protein